MSGRHWAAGATAVAALAAALALVVVHVAQRHYERSFALRMARTTTAYIAAVTPPPPPPPPPRSTRPLRGRRAPPQPSPPPPPAPPPTPAARSYDLPSLLTQARALRTIPGWTSEVEVYFGTAPLVDATASPLTPDDLNGLERTGERWRARDRSALVPLPARDTAEVVGAVQVRPRRLPHGPLPGGLGFALPAALLAVGAAAAIAFRERSLRQGGYVGAVLVLALACYLDVRAAARQSTDRWLADTRKLLQEAATRLPAPRVRVAVSDLAALIRDGEVVPGEPGELAARRVDIDGKRTAVAAVLIGAGRWVELRTVPAEREAPRWLLLLLPCALAGPFAIFLLRWAERSPIRRRRETAIAWTFLTPAVLHLAVFTIVPALYAIVLASSAPLKTLLSDPLTWTAFRTTAVYALYVPISAGLALAAALAVSRYRGRWGARLLGAALLLPYAASVVAVGLLSQMIARAGSLGTGRLDWLSSPATALGVLMVISVWVHTGGQMLVFLAGLRRIPQAYTDAALVDGAGPWRRFRRITLPLLRPLAGFVLVTGLLSAFQMFTLASVLTQGGPGRATQVVVHRVYETAFGAHAVGAASAIALLMFLVLLLLRWPQLKLVSRRVSDAQA